jgi:hypothetical protein
LEPAFRNSLTSSSKEALCAHLSFVKRFHDTGNLRWADLSHRARYTTYHIHRIRAKWEDSRIAKHRRVLKKEAAYQAKIDLAHDQYRQSLIDTLNFQACLRRNAPYLKRIRRPFIGSFGLQKEISAGGAISRTGSDVERNLLDRREALCRQKYNYESHTRSRGEESMSG